MSPDKAFKFYLAGMILIFIVIYAVQVLMIKRYGLGEL